MDWTWLCLGLAALPAALGAHNLWRLPTLSKTSAEGVVSVLIPARNEAANIEACVAAALASRGVAVEVVVIDDGSTDGTAEIVQRLAADDPRVRLIAAPPLPPGWTGKVHACARLAEAARGDRLLFIDADVRLAPGAAAAMAAHAKARDLAMVSGVPRQVIGSLGEALTVPGINFLLLGYLPGGGRAESKRADMAAACGQLVLCDRPAYEAIGGHGAVREVLHDGLALARRFRAEGHRTEVVDGAPLATCRMYHGFRESWAGFLKNAREGMATPLGLPVWTVMLGGAHLWPWALLPEMQAFLAIALMLALRAAITLRVREPWWTIPLHPFGMLVALAIQWWALARWAAGKPAGWKGRAYPATRAA
ncbi:glycosyltransferase [Paracraurococcus ruber]|uniref:Glycosyl transferase n=1 Tax=Paracraurococcus ruber TaxID=77675 RepID=A0ABS1D281_9PROT|nr:glycosyltransferase family 2 protein [Paracraurococcus ruber]MBK1660618.1 glycosyl transferase [Paracraurococcus ruber]TDG26794.1 glycosyltransferase [Paracraurococcus ruber]